jgi:hypothetical protein
MNKQGNGMVLVQARPCARTRQNTRNPPFGRDAAHAEWFYGSGWRPGQTWAAGSVADAPITTLCHYIEQQNRPS